jgi:hypothetical protein
MNRLLRWWHNTDNRRKWVGEDPDSTEAWTENVCMPSSHGFAAKNWGNDDWFVVLVSL